MELSLRSQCPSYDRQNSFHFYLSYSSTPTTGEPGFRKRASIELSLFLVVSTVGATLAADNTQVGLSIAGRLRHAVRQAAEDQTPPLVDRRVTLWPKQE